VGGHTTIALPDADHYSIPSYELLTSFARSGGVMKFSNKLLPERLADPPHSQGFIPFIPTLWSKNGIMARRRAIGEQNTNAV
jgi:hypothetical protein